MPLVIRANLITVQSNAWTHSSTQEAAHLHLFLLLSCWLVLHRLDNVVFHSSSLTRSTEKKKKEKCLCGKVWSMKVNRPLGNQVEQLQRRSWVMSRLLWRNAVRYSSKSRLDWKPGQYKVIVPSAPGFGIWYEQLRGRVGAQEGIRSWGFTSAPKAEPPSL